MFQGLIESILKKLIGEYVENLDKKSLKVSVSQIVLALILSHNSGL